LSFRLDNIDLSYRSRDSKANFLNDHGAIFLAINAASMAIVPLPQKKSYKGSLNFHQDKSKSPAASDSLIGASPVAFLYHLLCSDSPVVLRRIEHISFSIWTKISIGCKFGSSKSFSQSVCSVCHCEELFGDSLPRTGGEAILIAIWIASLRSQ
jgi:hypothetical protein